MQIHSPVELLRAKPAVLSTLSHPMWIVRLAVNWHPIHPSRTFRQYSLHLHRHALDRQVLLVCAPKATRITIGDASHETNWERKHSRRFQRPEGTQSPAYLVEET